MSITVTTLTCPNCGANFEAKDGKTIAYCEFCGTKLVMVNENEHILRKYETIEKHETIHNIVTDEADIKRAETERMVELQKLQLTQTAISMQKRKKFVKILIPLILGIIAVSLIIYSSAIDKDTPIMMIGIFLIFVCVGIVINFHENDDEVVSGETVRIPKSVENYKSKTRAEIEAEFTSAGFTNIRCIPKNDLTIGLLKRAETVASISVNGTNIETGGKRVAKDSPVIIAYHSFKGRG